MRAKEKHGMSAHPAYWVWSKMIDRCHNTGSKDYRFYGERGTSVCQEWRTSFVAFWRDMGGTYAEGLTLDRRDGAGSYCKTNCRWITQAEQTRNQRSNIFVGTSEGRICLAEAARKFGVNYRTLLRRVELNWPDEELFKPPQPPTATRRHRDRILA